MKLMNSNMYHRVFQSDHVLIMCGVLCLGGLKICCGVIFAVYKWCNQYCMSWSMYITHLFNIIVADIVRFDRAGFWTTHFSVQLLALDIRNLFCSRLFLSCALLLHKPLADTSLANFFLNILANGNIFFHCDFFKGLFTNWNWTVVYVKGNRYIWNTCTGKNILILAEDDIN